MIMDMLEIVEYMEVSVNVAITIKPNALKSSFGSYT